MIGGFTSKPWRDVSGEYDDDGQAFLFSLTQKSKHKTFNGKKAIFHHNEWLICFDGNSGKTTIGLIDKCDKNDSYSLTFKDNDYMPPPGIKPNT